MRVAGNVREARIDIVRGLAMLVIAINHITVAFRMYGFEGRGIITPTDLGYSSSASLFVIMSGYMVGLVYVKKPKPSVAILLRARTLYGYNLVLIFAVTPFLLMMSNSEAASWGASFLLANSVTGLFKFLVLIKAPTLLDVLQMYVIFMIVTPLALWVYGKSPFVLAAASVMLWTLCQVATATRVIEPAAVQWRFNPAAWQLLFFIPMILGAGRAHERIFYLLGKYKYLTLILALIAAAMGIAKVYHFEEIIPGSYLLSSKGNLGALRILHALVVLTLYCGLLMISPNVPNLAPMRALACLGRQTLRCYVASAWLTYALAFAWHRSDGGIISYYGAVFLAVFVAFCTAAIFDAKGTAKT